MEKFNLSMLLPRLQIQSYGNSRLVDSCWVTNDLDSLVQVFQSPIADYTSSRTLGCFESNFILFSDQSTNAVQWNWTFGENGEFATSTDQNPQVNFNEYGDYSVQLTVTSAEGCTNTSVQDTIHNQSFL